MAILAVNGQDFFILATMLVGIIAAVTGAVKAKLAFVKVGVVLSAVITCLGMVYFGWKPLFGGQRDSGTYFGSTMLFLGLASGIVFAAIEEAYRRVVGAPDPRQGFPITPSRPK